MMDILGWWLVVGWLLVAGCWLVVIQGKGEETWGVGGFLANGGCLLLVGLLVGCYTR
tara:strand:+ start:1392 stop:1562 length:171 start_codon:yes stop_codon:yes gene_type:complete